MVDNPPAPIELRQLLRRYAQPVTKDHQLVDKGHLQYPVLPPAAAGGGGGRRNCNDPAPLPHRMDQGIVLHDRLIGKSTGRMKIYSPHKQALIAIRTFPNTGTIVCRTLNECAPPEGFADSE